MVGKKRRGQPAIGTLVGADTRVHGDIGDAEVADRLESFKPLRAVYGNIDDKDIRTRFPEDLIFDCEGLSVWITHIGGTPPRYNPRITKILKTHTPHIFICGHSHILKVMPDKGRRNMIYINPGAAGQHGFHKVRTIIKMELDNKKIVDMKVVELGLRGR